MKKSLIIRISLFGALACSIVFFVKTIITAPLLSTQAYGAPSHPQLHGKIFPVDSLAPLSSIATGFPTTGKMKVISYVSDRCPFCTRYLQTIGELETKISEDFDFYPVYLSNQPFSEEYLTTIHWDQPLYSGKGLSLSSEINLVPTLLFLNENNEIIHTSQGSPEGKEVLEAMLTQIREQSNPS